MGNYDYYDYNPRDFIPMNRPDWCDSNGLCKECSYPVCVELYQGYTCPFHEQDHERYHDAWSRAVESEFTPVISNHSIYRPFPLKSCASCEEPINETNHVCKAAAGSADWLDIMRKLK